MSLAIVTCFFNFAGFKRPQANLHRFLRQNKRDGVEVFGVEMSFSGEFLTLNEPHWTHVVLDPTRQSVWQKEAALNLAAKSLPPEVTAVAWVDADVWFDNPYWAKDTLSNLKECDVVQLFSTCNWTTEEGRVSLSLPSSGRVAPSPLWKGHPGFAWAMRRSLWDKAKGLYPLTLSGGGDALMSVAFHGGYPWPELSPHLGVNDTPFRNWVKGYEGIRVGYIPGNLYHEWHGDMKDRDYRGRALRLKDFDAARHLEFDKRGLLRWTEEAPAAIIKTAAEYFPSRREDGK